MYFSRGNLPWQERYLGGGKGGTKEDKYKRILDKKDPAGCLEMFGRGMVTGWCILGFNIQQDQPKGRANVDALPTFFCQLSREKN